MQVTTKGPLKFHGTITFWCPDYYVVDWGRAIGTTVVPSSVWDKYDIHH